jgi:hypothetical protein
MRLAPPWLKAPSSTVRTMGAREKEREKESKKDKRSENGSGREQQG